MHVWHFNSKCSHIFQIKFRTFLIHSFKEWIKCKHFENPAYVYVRKSIVFEVVPFSYLFSSYTTAIFTKFHSNLVKEILIISDFRSVRLMFGPLYWKVRWILCLVLLTLDQYYISIKLQVHICYLLFHIFRVVTISEFYLSK